MWEGPAQCWRCHLGTGLSVVFLKIKQVRHGEQASKWCSFLVSSSVSVSKLLALTPQWWTVTWKCKLKGTLFSLSCFRSRVYHSDRNWIRTGTVLISTVALVKYPDRSNLEDKESISDLRSKSQWQELKRVGHIAFMGQRDMNACMLAWLVFCLVLNLGPKIKILIKSRY